MTSGETFRPGTELYDGRFVITGVIASGGQAITYEGLDKREGRKVAIKRFSVRGASSWKEVELAEREARVLSGLNHAALPKVVAHFEDRGALYLVLEYVEGATLDELHKSHRLKQDDVVDYLTQVADILHYLHAQSPPIVHRDIKPRNVIRRPDGRIVLVDFGSVRDKLRPEGGSTVVGTFGYMAPEQFQGRANPASDTYGAAATALTLLTGREPDQLPHQGLRLDVEKALGSSASPAMKQLLTACLDPNPDTRPASLKDALGRYPLQPHQATDRARGQGSSRAHSRTEMYAELGDAPFTTPGYQRDRTHKNRRERRHERRDQRRQERRERRYRQRAARHERQYGPTAVDIERPLLDALRLPEVRRVLRYPLVGFVLFLLLMVLRTALWMVLAVLLPRLLRLVQRVTGARLLDTAQQTGEVGETLHEQLTRVASQVRHPDVDRSPAPDAPDAPRYRVVSPTPSKYDQIADHVEQQADEIEAEIEAALHGWDQRSRK